MSRRESAFGGGCGALMGAIGLITLALCVIWFVAL